MATLSTAETNDIIRSVGLNERLRESVANSPDIELICQAVRDHEFSDDPSQDRDFGVIEVNETQYFFSCDKAEDGPVVTIGRLDELS